MGWPTIPQVLDAILPMLELTGLYLAEEFSTQVDPKTLDEYLRHHGGLPTEVIPHNGFKERVDQCLGIIHTGDPVPYSAKR